MFSAYKPKKIFVALTDADGCIYNKLHQMLFINLIIGHHQFFEDYALSEKHYLDNQEIADKRLTEIIEEQDKLVTYENSKVKIHINDPSFNDYKAMTSKLFECTGYNEPFDDDERDSLTQIIKSCYLNYINNCGEIGKKLLNTIVFTANKPYLYELKSVVESGKYDDLILMCGSNRQCFVIDKFNNEQNVTTSFFPTLIALSEKLNELLKSGESGVQCALDMLLMADIFDNKEPGFSFKLILEHFKDERVMDLYKLQHSTCPFDKRKFSLLYGAMHHISSKHAYDKITFSFWEDRADIYCPLMEVFETNDRLIPNNIFLELDPYPGFIFSDRKHKTESASAINKGYMFSKQGKGMIDLFYADSVKRLAELSGYVKEEKTLIDTIKHIDFVEFEKLRHRLGFESVEVKEQNDSSLRPGM